MEKIDTIVIGSGMGGLACSAALARAGQRVLLLEQHYVAGGMTHTFKRKGYVWDVGVHCLGEMDEGCYPRKILDWLTEGRVTMHKYDHVYDSFTFTDGTKIDLPGDREEYFANLKSKFPKEIEGIEAYKTAVNKAAKSGYGHFFSQLLPTVLSRFLTPILAYKFKYWSQLTTKEVVEKCVKTPELRAILTAQWGYYGPPPSKSSFYIHAVTVRHFWYGGFYPVGGAQVFAEEMIKTIEAAGGKVMTRTPVKELLFEDDKVVGVVIANETQTKFYAPVTISAVGARATIKNLLPATAQQTTWAKNILKLKQSPCHVALYLGFQGDIKAAGARASNQWFYESYDMEKTEWNVHDANSIAPILYVSFPSLKDPKHKSEMHTGEVVTFVPYDAFEKWHGTNVRKRGDDYLQFKKDLEERLLNQLFKWMPDLKKYLVFHEFSTPLSTEFYCRAPQGAIYGISPTPERFRTRELRPQTPYKNFYLTGSDVGTLGVVGAMVGGLLTAAKLRPKIWKEFR